MTGEWLSRAGLMGAIVAFVIGGVVITLISLTYAELASAMPRAGGEHVYTLRALGRTPSFICTWALLMAYVTVPVFESAALPTALEYLFPDLATGRLWTVAGADVHITLVAIGITAAVVMTAVNYVGVSFAATVQGIVTALFFLVGVAFITGSAAQAPWSSLSADFTNGFAGILGVLIMVPALMIGFDVIPQTAEEANVAPKILGQVLITSVALAVLWYILITASVGVTLGDTLGNARVATADANAAVWGSKIAGNLMIIAGIGGILTSWNAFILGASRVVYALAESGMLPRVFARLHPRFHTPHIAILAIGALSVLSPLFGRTILVWLIDAGSFAVVIAYGMVAWAFLALRRDEPDMLRPYRVRHGKIVGWAALLLSIALALVYLPFSPAALVWPYEWLMVLGWSGLGGMVYIGMRVGKQP